MEATFAVSGADRISHRNTKNADSLLLCKELSVQRMVQLCCFVDNKRVRADIKRASSDTIRLQKKTRKGKTTYCKCPLILTLLTTPLTQLQHPVGNNH